MTSIASSAPPGGRGAPPGGEEPPGGRSAPGGRPPRLSIGKQGGSFRRPRLPGTLGGRLGAGQKQVVKTTVKPARASLREEVGKYIKQRPDLASSPTEPQDAYTPPKGMGRGKGPPAGKRKSRAQLQAELDALQADKEQRIQDAQNLNKASLAETEAALRQPTPKVEETEEEKEKDRRRRDQIAEIDWQNLKRLEREEATEQDPEVKATLQSQIEGIRTRLKTLGSPGHQQGGANP